MPPPPMLSREWCRSVFASATVSGNNLVMTYTGTSILDATNLPATTAFTVIGRTPIAVNS